MTLEGANNFSENNNSTIYTMNSVQTGQYCVVVPKNIGDKVRMLVDLNMKKSFDSLINNSITKDSLVTDINEEYSNIEKDYSGSVLVIPMIDVDEFGNSVNSNDKQTIFNETKKIGSITSEIYQKLCNSGVDKAKIDQKIVIIEKTDVDKKFVSWLEEQMPNFVDGVDYNELANKTIDNNINPFTGDVSEPAISNDIFGPQVSENKLDEVPQVADTVSGEAKLEESIPNTNSVVNETNNNSGDLYVQSDSLAQVNEPVVSNEVTDSNVETKEGVSNVSDNGLVKDNDAVVEPEVSNIERKSRGFANLLILLVILIGVTVASIELGKLLYNTFGA